MRKIIGLVTACAIAIGIIAGVGAEPAEREVELFQETYEITFHNPGRFSVAIDQENCVAVYTNNRGEEKKKYHEVVEIYRWNTHTDTWNSWHNNYRLLHTVESHKGDTVRLRAQLPSQINVYERGSNKRVEYDVVRYEDQHRTAPCTYKPVVYRWVVADDIDFAVVD